MGLLPQTVPLHVYERKCAEYDALLEKYHSLRLAGHAPTKPVTLHLPQPDSGQLAVMGAEIALRSEGARKMVDELMAKGMTEAAALREVEGMQNVARGRTVPPMAGDLR